MSTRPDECPYCNMDHASNDHCPELDGPEDDGPDEDSLVTSDGRNFYQYGKLVLTISEDQAGDSQARDLALRDFMDSEQFWPDVWSISDHGNPELIL